MTVTSLPSGSMKKVMEGLPTIWLFGAASITPPSRMNSFRNSENLECMVVVQNWIFLGTIFLTNSYNLSIYSAVASIFFFLNSSNIFKLLVSN